MGERSEFSDLRVVGSYTGSDGFFFTLVIILVNVSAGTAVTRHHRPGGFDNSFFRQLSSSVSPRDLSSVCGEGRGLQHTNCRAHDSAHSCQCAGRVPTTGGHTCGLSGRQSWKGFSNTLGTERHGPLPRATQVVAQSWGHRTHRLGWLGRSGVWGGAGGGSHCPDAALVSVTGP